MTPLLIAHRGDTINFPENTIEAFQSALDKRADGIELDVQLGKKGEVIIVHNLTHDENKQYPLLENVLQQFGPRIILEIELKGFELEIVNKVVDLIHKYQPAKYSITSSVLLLLPYVRQALPQALVGAILSDYVQDWMTPKIIERMVTGYMHLTGATAVHLNPKYFSKPLVDFLRRQGFITHGHIFTDDIKEFKKMKSLGIDRCTFDNINLLKKIKK